MQCWTQRFQKCILHLVLDFGWLGGYALPRVRTRMEMLARMSYCVRNVLILILGKIVFLLYIPLNKQFRESWQKDITAGKEEVSTRKVLRRCSVQDRYRNTGRNGDL